MRCEREKNIIKIQHMKTLKNDSNKNCDKFQWKSSSPMFLKSVCYIYLLIHEKRRPGSLYLAQGFLLNHAGTQWHRPRIASSFTITLCLAAATNKSVCFGVLSHRL